MNCTILHCVAEVCVPLVQYVVFHNVIVFSIITQLLQCNLVRHILCPAVASRGRAMFPPRLVKKTDPAAFTSMGFPQPKELMFSADALKRPMLPFSKPKVRSRFKIVSFFSLVNLVSYKEYKIFLRNSFGYIPTHS